MAVYYIKNHQIYLQRLSNDLKGLVLTNDMLKTNFPNSVLLPLPAEEFMSKYGEKLKEGQFDDWMKDIDMKSREEEYVEEIDRKGMNYILDNG
jgi:hypothetical protein